MVLGTDSCPSSSHSTCSDGSGGMVGWPRHLQLDPFPHTSPFPAPDDVILCPSRDTLKETSILGPVGGPTYAQNAKHPPPISHPAPLPNIAPGCIDPSKEPTLEAFENHCHAAADSELRAARAIFKVVHDLQKQVVMLHEEVRRLRMGNAVPEWSGRIWQ